MSVRNEASSHLPDSVRQTPKVLHRLYSDEGAIYGTVLVSALIAVGYDDDTDLDVLLFTLGSIAVFWVAHVYAGAVADLHLVDGHLKGVGRSILHSMRRASSILLPMLLPAVFLFLAVVHVLDEYVAFYLALATGTVVLGVLGWVAFALRGASWRGRVLGALSTAALGVAVVALSTLTH